MDHIKDIFKKQKSDRSLDELLNAKKMNPSEHIFKENDDEYNIFENSLSS